MAGRSSELQVITYAKKLSSYVMTVTQKAYRFIDRRYRRFMLMGQQKKYRCVICHESFEWLFVSARSFL